MYFARIDKDQLVIFSCISFAGAIKNIGSIYYQLYYIMIMEVF